MIKLSLFRSPKVLCVIVIILEFAVCLALGFAVRSKREIQISKMLGIRLIPKEQCREIQDLQNQQNQLTGQLSQLAGQYDALSKATVPAGKYNRLVGIIQALKRTIIETKQAAPEELWEQPEQICGVIDQILHKSKSIVSSVSSAAEIDFLVSVVEKEIAAQGVVDTKQTDKYAVCLYHMQKVLDAVGYGIGNTTTDTNQAVLKFQNDNQLKADGKVGAKTWTKVRELWNAKKPRS